jgi:hypothetical protein
MPKEEGLREIDKGFCHDSCKDTRSCCNAVYQVVLDPLKGLLTLNARTVGFICPTVLDVSFGEGGGAILRAGPTLVIPDYTVSNGRGGTCLVLFIIIILVILVMMARSSSPICVSALFEQTLWSV